MEEFYPMILRKFVKSEGNEMDGKYLEKQLFIFNWDAFLISFK
jgi:hypothetical protein